jgi:tetratricopeptide (TPR) repeat protein
MTEMHRPEDRLGKRSQQSLLGQAWRQMSDTEKEHPSSEVLAAYAEGVLLGKALASCEKHLASCPECLDQVSDLWAYRAASAPMPVQSSRFLPRGGAWVLSVAASVLLSAGGLFWGLWQTHKVASLTENVKTLDQQLQEKEMDLATVHKAAFLAAAPSGIRSYWNGTTTPQTLQLPVVRGKPEPGPDALWHEDHAKDSLLLLARNPNRKGQAFLELASLETAAAHLDAAEEYLKQAETELGASPEVRNSWAVWHLARGKEADVKEAERLLSELTRQHPDYLPAWYNLALLLQRTFRDQESRDCWKEYLRHETRPEYRRAAELRRDS